MYLMNYIEYKTTAEEIKIIGKSIDEFTSRYRISVMSILFHVGH